MRKSTFIIQKMKHQYRIAVMGSSASGKTALIKRFVSDEIVESYDPTIEDTFKKSISYNGIVAHLEILDTAGKMECYLKELVIDMLTRYIDSADAFMIVYSVGSRRSFEHALSLFSQIAKRRGTHSVPRVLVGSKCDSDYREVSPDEGNVLSAQLQCSFAETSATKNMNVLEVFEELVSQLRYIEMMRRTTSAQPGQWYHDKKHNFCCFL